MLISLLEALRIALRSLVRNPGRSGLTILGLSIGIAAFIAMVSFGQGARTSVVDQFQKFGINVLKIKRRGAQATSRSPSPLTDKDVERLLRETTSLRYVVPVIYKSTVLSFEGRQYVVPINGTTPEFIQVRDWSFQSGGMFDEYDQVRRNKVCVLGQTPALELFGGQDPLGKTFTAENLRCRVVGVLASKGAATSGRDLDNFVLTPVSTFKAYIEALDVSYGYIDVKPWSSDLREVARAEIEDVLRRSHDLPPDRPDDFVISSPDDATQVADDVSQILTGLLAGIAGVSLLVGGIGIMNIQLVAVAERTQEIGIRSAIGASPGQILLQFLTEAVLLAFVGTVLGAVMGMGIAIGVAQAMRWPTTVPVSVIVIAVLFGSGVGVLFGFLPAQRASRLDPIEALRRE